MKDLAILVKARESHGPWRNWKFFKNPHLTYYGRLTMLGVWTPAYTEEEHQTKSLKKLFLWLLFFRGGERYSWGDLKYVWLTSVLKTSNISFHQRWLMKLKCEDECSGIKKAIDFLIMEPSGHGPVGVWGSWELQDGEPVSTLCHASNWSTGPGPSAMATGVQGTCRALPKARLLPSTQGAPRTLPTRLPPQAGGALLGVGLNTSKHKS